MPKPPKKVTLSQNKKEEEMEMQEESVHSDNSLSDFRTPNRGIFTRSKLQKTKFSRKTTNAKLKATKGRKDHSTNKHATNKELNSGQTLIESSFFKSKETSESDEAQENAKLGHVCPLCFKVLKNTTAQALHMKTCAAKNKISTKKLFEAKELQERQAAERASLGLLSAPVLQEKKKPVSHKTNSNVGSDLELALALSKSLHEREERWEVNDPMELHQLASTHDSKTARDDCNGTLQNFGFVTNKPIATRKKGKIIGQTVLQTRSQAERERLLTERIAEILMGDDSVTQALHNETSTKETDKLSLVIQSQRLRKMQQVEAKLWNKTRLSPNQKNFYVKSLSPHVTKPEKQSNSANFDNHNMTKSPPKRQNISENPDMPESHDKKSSMFPADEHDTDSPTEKDSVSSKVSEKMDSTTTDNFIDSLVSDWGNALNNSAMSDVIVLAEKDKRIWVHKLVLSVRCSNILLDITPNDDATSSAKEIIRWSTVPHSAALAFLEFIYCGTIKMNFHVLKKDSALLNIRCLARKYRVKELFNYLRIQQKSGSFKSPGKNDSCEKGTAGSSNLNLRRSTSEMTMKEYSNLQKTRNTSETVQDNENLTSSSVKRNFSETHFDHASIDKASSLENVDLRTELAISRHNSVSPDLFDDAETVKLHDTMKSDNGSAAGNSLACNDNELASISINFDSRFYNSKSLPSEQISPEGSKRVDAERNTGRKMERASSNGDLPSSPLPSNDISDMSIVGTPRSTKFDWPAMASSTLNTRQKGNLTLFIEKVQRMNAKSICESDSDMDTFAPERPPVWKRNPFNINKYDDSMCTPPSNSKEQEKITEKRRHALSKLEDDIRVDAIKNPELYNLTPKRINDEEMKSPDVAHPPMSKGTKRKSSEISNDRINQPNNIKEISIENEDTVQTSPIISQNNSRTNCSVSDVDTDEENMSMYSRYKRKRVDNSIAKYRDLLKLQKLQKSTLSENPSEKSSPTKERINRGASKIHGNNSSKTVNNDEVIVLSDWESDDSTTSTVILPRNYGNGQTRAMECSQQRASCSSKSTVTSNIVSLRHSISKNDLSDKATDRDTTIKETVPIEPSIYDAETDTENESSTQWRRNEGGDDSTHRNRSHRSTEETMNTNSENERNRNNPSTDSPEVCIQDENFDTTSYNTLNTDAAVNIDDIATCYSAKCTKQKKSYDSSPISLSCSPERDTRVSETTNKRRRVTDNEMMRSRDKSGENIQSVDVEGSSLDSVSRAPDATNLRKSQSSSLSDEDLCADAAYKRNEAIRNASNSTPKHGKTKANHGISQKLEYIIVDRDVTPPPNYETMPTPELHTNLRKYGLKLHKRKTAVKLLTYIYDQLHPLIPITAEKDSEVKENKTRVAKNSPVKQGRVQSKNTSAEKENIERECGLNRFLSQSSRVSGHSKGSNHAAEVERNESESESENENEAATDITVATNVKEAFVRLAKKNKELYNKILTYEPLNIHALHAMLKVEGFKCKLSSLMNFLDEQCITFQLLEKNDKTRTRSRPFVSKQ